MKTTNGNSMDASSVPLARDANGNVISLPDGSAAWSVRRETGGRPRRLLGVDRKWLRLPLDTSIEDVEAMLGAGAYRLDLINEEGSPLGVTVPVAIGIEAEVAEPARPPTPRVDEPLVSLPASGTDLRMLLEANVRAMQLSFQHNERSLETSLRVVDSLRDGVKVLADAQAQWVKALAATHTIRNAPHYPMPAREEDDDDENDEEDEEYDQDDDENAGFWTKLGENLAPYQDVIVATLRNKISGWVTGNKSDGAIESAELPPRNARTKKREPSRGELLAMVMQKIDTAKKILTEDEITLLRHHLAKMPDAERDRWITQLAPLSVEDAVVQIRIALSQIGTEQEKAS